MGEWVESSQFTVGDWTVEPGIGQISRDGESTVPEPRVMDLLVYLADRAGQTGSTDELASEVWAGRAISDQPVYQGIAQLRKALNDEARHPRYIATVTKKGYRLVAPVAGVGISDVVAQPARQQPKYLMPALSLLLAGTYLFLSSSDVSVSQEQAVSTLISSIAVLPFIDMSEDGSKQYLGDGLAEELIHRIAMDPEMKVVARTSSFAFRDGQTDIKEIGERLGADVILEGSVRQSGGKLRITAQLVDASSGYHIWSETYEPTVANAFAVQDHIAANLAELLQVGASVEALPARSWTENAEAANAYYLGMFHLHKRRPESLDKSLAYLHQAIASDPQFALAYAALAKAYFLASDARYGLVPDEEAAERSRAALETAKALDDQLPEVLELLALKPWDDGNPDAAESLYLRAIGISPNYAPVYKSYGQLLRATDRPVEALGALKKAVELDPLSPVIRINLAQAYRMLNHYAEAEAQLLTAIELDPTWHIPYYTLGRILPDGEIARAIELGKKAFSIEGPDARLAGDAAMLVAYGYVSLQDFTAAERWHEKAEELGVDGWWLANERIHSLIAQDRYKEADALLSYWESKNTDIDNVYRLGGLYRAVMGQDSAATGMLEHAMTMTEDGDAQGLANDTDLYWGYAPAVHLAYLYMMTGRDGLASELLDLSDTHITLTEKIAPRIPGAHYVRALIHALRGNDHEAMASLQQAADSGWTRAWFAERDPILAEYRDDRAFQAILNQMKRHLIAERRKLVKLAEATP